MKLPGAAIVVSAFCLLISCGGDGNGGGKGGSGGSGGAAGGSAGVSGSAGNTGAAGTAGATGSAGSGGSAACEACNACVRASCGTQIATCMANSACNMIYECVNSCTTSVQTCIQNNIAAAQMFAASVYPCITSNCGTQCMQ